jgi:hypothetical protein
MTTQDGWDQWRVCMALADGKRVAILMSQSGREWAAYILAGDGKFDVPVSPIFSVDAGQTVDDCIAACRKVYGIWLNDVFARRPKLKVA